MFTLRDLRECVFVGRRIIIKKRVILEIVNAAIYSHTLFLKITTWFLAECIVHSEWISWVQFVVVLVDAVDMHPHCCHAKRTYLLIISYNSES